MRVYRYTHAPLVIEHICQHTATQADAKPACATSSYLLDIPFVGD
jgi:hypothetical protein